MNLSSVLRPLSIITIIGALTACASNHAHYYGSSLSRSPSLATHRMKCALHPEECMYSGPYEVGEDIYAEEEAKRLNRDALRRFRRSSRYPSAW